MKKNQLACPKCKKDYDLGDRLPRLIPGCCHTFCSYCLLRIFRRKKVFACPKDKQQFDNIIA